MFIEKVIRQFDKHNIPYALAGGHAVALHGAVRGTLDLDFIVTWSLKNLHLTKTALEEIGLRPRGPTDPEDLFRSREEYIKNRNLIAWNFTNPDNPCETVDIVTNFHLSPEMVQQFDIGSMTINVLAKEHLIAMKKSSGREQDLLDVAALENKKADR